MSKRRTFSIEEKLSVLREVEENGITETCRLHDLCQVLLKPHALFPRRQRQFHFLNDSGEAGIIILCIESA